MVRYSFYTSLKYFPLGLTYLLENLFCAGTYNKVLEKVAQPALDSADIHYRTQVSEIHGKSTGPNGKTKVKTVNGQTFEFDEVVVTCPLGWLKRNLQAFLPPLPDRVSRGIQSIGYGTLEKVSIYTPQHITVETTRLTFLGLHIVPYCLLAHPFHKYHRRRPHSSRVLPVALTTIRARHQSPRLDQRSG